MMMILNTDRLSLMTALVVLCLGTTMKVGVLVLVFLDGQFPMLVVSPAISALALALAFAFSFVSWSWSDVLGFVPVSSGGYKLCSVLFEVL